MMLITRWTICSWLVIALSLMGCFYQVSDLQNRVMFANHEAEVSNLQSALVAAWVHEQVAHQQPLEVKQEGINPMRFMYLPNLLYVGEFEYLSDDLRSVWFYDTQQDCLVYVFENGDTRAYQLMPNASINNVMRMGIWQLKRIADYQPIRMAHNKMAG